MTVVQMKRPEVEPGTFEEFWQAYPYPRRTGKVLARTKWEAITNGGLETRTLDRDSGQYVNIQLQAEPGEILEGLKRYARSMQKGDGYEFKDDGKYICHPSTFLNQGRWLDWI